MFNQVKFASLSLVVLLVLSGSAAAAPIIVNIDNPSFRKLVVALPDFEVSDPNDKELVQLAKEGPVELGRLLQFSGLFNILNAAGYSDIKLGSTAGKDVRGMEGVETPAWKRIGVESLTVGDLARDGADITISLRTADINQNKLMLGKKYTKVKPDQFKKVMAKYADRLLEAYTGKPGIFSTQLVFVGRKSKGAAKQIYVSEFDGSNAVAVTSGNSPHLSPSWSPDGKFITFTSFEAGNPDLYIYDLAGGKKKKLSNRSGLNSGSNWAKSGKVIAFTGSEGGDTDIYSMTPDGAGAKAIIRGSGLDVDPTFSPDGKWMAFVSGRFGNPHLFRAELKWENDTTVKVLSDKRLTYAGWYNATPTWSPESDKIIFAGYDKDIDRFDLFMMNHDGTSLERLTIRAGDNERPSFAPNGQMVVFHSTRSQGRDVKGPAQLFVMNRDGSGQRQLTTGLYDAQTPQWGPPVE